MMLGVKNWVVIGKRSKVECFPPSFEICSERVAFLAPEHFTWRRAVHLYDIVIYVFAMRAE